MNISRLLWVLLLLVAGIAGRPASAAEVRQEWVRETVGAQDDGLGSIVVRTDPSGNAYLGATGNGAYRTVKYDRAGNELWSKTFGGTPQQHCYAEALSVDGSGNVYVTGECRDEAYNFDMVTIKYDASGTALWTVRYDNPQGGRDFALGLAVDNEGSVYVAGSSFRNESGSDFTTVKYSADGIQLWVASYDAGAFIDPLSGRSRPSNDQAHAITLDMSDNVYVTGTTRLLAANHTATEFATIKYDPAGNQVWVRNRPAGGEGPRASRLAVDRDGSVYVAGSRRPGNDCLGHQNPSAASLVKYSSDGALQWEAQYPLTEPFVIAAMAIGPSGDVSITGTLASDGCANSGTGNYSRTMQFSPDGAVRWYVSRYTYPSENWAGSLSVDLQDNVYVTGFQGYYGMPSNVRHGRAFTEKYDTTGASLWVMQYDGPNNNDIYNSGTYGNAIAVDDQGNVYVAGKSWKDSYWPSIVTVRYSQPIPNQPPVAVPGPDQTVECSGPQGSTVTLDGSGSSDPDGDALQYVWTWGQNGRAVGMQASVTLPLGMTIVTLTVDDGKGGVSSAPVKIFVQDTKPPTTSIELAGTPGTNGWYTSDVVITLSSTDACSGVKEIRYAVDGTETTAAGSAAVVTVSVEGNHTFDFFATDNAGNHEVVQSRAVNIDKTPPELSVSLHPNILWPPDHRIVNVTPVIAVHDNLDAAPQVKLLSVTSNEPDHGLGDGDTANDIVINSDGTISLRAERSGSGQGRVYTITYQAVDSAGNTSTASATVTVPRNK